MIEDTKEFYDNLYKNGHGLKGFRANNWAMFLKSRIFDIKFDSVLDVGCGNGLFLEECIKLGKKAHGVDISEFSLNDASLKSYFTCMDVCNDNLPRGYDLAVSTDMMEHLPESKINFAITNISKSANRLFIIVALYDDNESHITIKPTEWWTEQFNLVDKNIKFVEQMERKPGKHISIFQR